jgi:hypothetical protein
MERNVLISIDGDDGPIIFWLRDILQIRASKNGGTLVALRPNVIFPNEIPDVFFVHSPLPIERVMDVIRKEAAHAK